jgi:hypothetical protein
VTETPKTPDVGDPCDWKEPATQDEAKSRRLRASEEYRQIQVRVAGLAKADTPLRRRLTAALAAKASELGRLNDAVHRLAQAETAEKKRVRLDGAVNGADLVKRTRAVMADLWAYLLGLENEVAALRRENADLRDLLAAARPDPVAPNSGVDEWRDANR